ncbi:type II secretion system F family protein [Fulvimarina sp. 2208YS6-2-32]|uniref:Type II secretion system F family protein n=1 Tax=Fulvimarina uroteuthidis TaxID=3098149 RepID=A0ABU5HZ94_9HYPH|nr:type II secretion system F family protein [Fulvimarina sp. 2208YS6-2-32]MDY8108448.1 type II secretion system F family protein [Fulvimarina sp. 2208YS6-2-32]
MQNVFSLIGIQPQVFFSVVLTLAVFASLLAVLLPQISRSKLQSRMKSVAIEREELRARERARMTSLNGQSRRGLRQSEEQGVAAKVVAMLNLKKGLVDEATIAKLRVAGFRSQRQLTLFLFARIALALGFLGIAMMAIFVLGFLAAKPFAVQSVAIVGFAYAGFVLPVFYVRSAAEKRQKSIQRAWPDALDLLLICVESGRSIEASFRKVAEEIGIQSIPLAEELMLTCAELSYLPERRGAYENLSARTELDGVKATMTALTQAERYGTPVGSALRVMAQENRDLRMNDAEKKAAALPPKLTVPMIVFFLPVLIVVILAPAVFNIMDTMSN